MLLQSELQGLVLLLLITSKHRMNTKRNYQNNLGKDLKYTLYLMSGVHLIFTLVKIQDQKDIAEGYNFLLFCQIPKC